MKDLKHDLKEILTPELFLAVYDLKIPWSKGKLPSGTAVGNFHFQPSQEYMQSFNDLIYYDALLPLSKIPFKSLLAIDLTEVLPDPIATRYPEQCIGLITLLDQTRILAKGYNERYTRAFFDPVCEKLARQLIALPADLRVDGKQAWLSRGYTVDDWLVRTLWVWAPLVHSDVFMTADRQCAKDWLHYMRAEVEAHAGVPDPFAPLEADDEMDIDLFQMMAKEGPPMKSYFKSDKEATVPDYAFWWIRILNSHFAITDVYGHYPYRVRWLGLEWNDKDKEYMERTRNYRYDPESEAIFRQVRQDHLDGVWRPMQPDPVYEK